MEFAVCNDRCLGTLNMRIAIEVDISPEEIPLARDLFAVLHQITTQIRPKDTRRLFQNVISALHGRCATYRHAWVVARGMAARELGGKPKIISSVFCTLLVVFKRAALPFRVVC